MRSAVVALLVLAAAVAVSAQAPIPYRPDGFLFGTGTTDSPIQMDMFLDLLCPDCAAAWPNVKSVADYYGSNINIKLHTFPLPYHTYGFMMAQAAHVVFYNATEEIVRSFDDYVFNGQSQFWNGNVANISSNQVLASMTNFIVTEGGFSDEADFSAGMMDDNINEYTRVSWKYACSKGVLGTPTFFVNDVNVNGDPSWTLAEWRTLLDPLLQPEPGMKRAVAKKVNKHHSAKKTLCNKNRKHRSFHSVPNACPTGEPECDYSPGKFECCYPGEMCIPNVGCRC